MINEFKNKVILITGGAGSIGSAVGLELLKYKPKAVRIFDMHEYSLYKLEQKIVGNKSNLMRYILGDVRDRNRLLKAMEGVDIVYHAAAYKHVPFCEYNPLEAVKTNVIGTENVVEAAIHNKVKKVVFISTDKAAHPTSTLGASKLLGEKIITAANYHKGKSPSIFSSVRFGNVTMSAGSVIPNFINQIKKGGPVTVTSPDMTRFLMPIRQAVDLIFRATDLMSGGEVFVFKMKAVKIIDLAESIIEKYPHRDYKVKKDILIKITKPRAGEKFREQLLVSDECERVVNMKDLLILLPPLNPPYQEMSHPLESKSIKIDINDYFSDRCLASKDEINDFICNNNIFESIFE